MRLVFVNRFFHPDLSATSQMLSDLAFGLVARGHEVHVVCSRQLYEDAQAKLSKEESIFGVQVHRVWSTSFGRINLFGRALDYLSFYVGALIVLLRVTTQGSSLIAKTDPPLISVVVAGVAWLRGAKLVNWLQDVFPEVAEQSGLRWAGGRVGAWIKVVRDWSLRYASANVVIGERMRELLVTRGIDAQRLHVVPNWADPNIVLPVAAADNPLLPSWGLQGQFVVMYSGNMGRAHEFDTILDAAESLRGDERVMFLFVGGGARKAGVAAEVQRRGLTNVRFLPYQPKAQLGASLSAGAVHLISLMPGQEGLIMPSKFYGVLAAGRPTLFVGDLDGEIARQVRRHGVGLAVAVGDAEGLRAAILQLAGDAEQRSVMGERARALLLQEHSKDAACRAWEAVLKQLH